MLQRAIKYQPQQCHAIMVGLSVDVQSVAGLC